jgi:hypothetical protein
MKTRPTEADGMKRRPKRLAVSRDRDAASRTVTGIEALKGQMPLIVLVTHCATPANDRWIDAGKKRLTRGGQLMDVASLTDLPRETAEHHDHDERPLRSTAGGTGPPPTSTHASRGAPRRRHPKLPGATWRDSETLLPHDFAPITVLSECLRRWVHRWVHRL